MEAIILAGGLGTRLRSVVADLPKCMAPVVGKPFLYYSLKYLGNNDFTHVIFFLGYKHEFIENWVNKNRWPFSISFSVEDEPLGTGGALKLALDHAREEHVLIMNGDIFFDVNLKKLYDFHKRNNSEISIALKPMSDFDRYGNVETNKNDKIIAFHEKQPCQKGQIDGVINRHLPDDYMKKWEEFEFLPGVLEAMKIFSRYFEHILVVTNQRGVGKGMMTEDDLIIIHNNMISEINRHQGRIDKVYYCTDIDKDSPNRKPNSGMALQAKRAL